MLFTKIIADESTILHHMNKLLPRLAVFAQKEIAPGPFKAYNRLLQRIANKAKLTGNALLYPAGGHDAWTAFKLHPKAESVVMLSREPFGLPSEMLTFLEELYGAALTKDSPVFSDYACQYDYDSELLLDELNGGYTLFKLAAYLNFHPVCIEKIDSQGLDITKITLTDEQGQKRYVWHVYTDLGGENPALKYFFKDFDFGGMLLKAALDIVNPRQDGKGFYKNVLQFVRAKDLPIIMDRPFNQSRYAIFEENYNPLQIKLGLKHGFGYSQGVSNESVEIAQGRNLLDYEDFLLHKPVPRVRFKRSDF